MKVFSWTSPLAWLAMCLVMAIGTVATSMPECAELCLVEYIGSSACQVATNVTCICTNTEFNAVMTECVLANCTIREQLTTKRFDAETCEWPVTDESMGLKVITPLFGILAVIFFLMRVWARWLSGLKMTWGSDDWVMMATTVASIPLTVVSYEFAAHGLGKDLWMVDFNDITFVLEMYYYSEILYLVVIFSTKISILCFYLRIFPKKQLRMRVLILIGLTVASAMAFIPITVFQCWPIGGAWQRWDGTYDATCRDVQLQALWGAVDSIALDVAVILMPMTELWGLQLSNRRKLGVMLMFATGAFVVIVEILRIVFLLKFKDTSNFTKDYTATSVWSNVEVYVGIMCACFPHVRTLLTRFAPRVFATTQRKTTGAGSSGFGNTGVYGNKSSAKFGSSSAGTKVSQRPVHGDETEFVELQPTPTSGDAFRCASNTDLLSHSPGTAVNVTRSVMVEWSEAEEKRYESKSHSHDIV